MSDNDKAPKSLEQLETEVVSLKIRIRRIEEYLRNQPEVDDYIGDYQEYDGSGSDDELLEKSIEIVRQYDRASASLLQRRLSIGYARAARLMDQLESKGVIGPADGSSKPREVFKNEKEK